MNFLLEYLKHPRLIGAVAPSGKSLSKKMMKPIDFASANVIVEYGPGTGAFTKELVMHRRPETVLLLIEQNRHFCKELEKTFKTQPNLHIIHGSAQKVKEYLNNYGFQYADYIVSGLPFTSMPKSISHSILNETQKAIGNKGIFVTFQYSLLKQKLFEQYFRIAYHLREMKNLPPAYVLVMNNYSKE